MVLTLYQQDILWGDAEGNRQQVEHCLASLSAPCDLFVVPETFTTGFGEHMASLSEPPEGPTLQWTRTIAARYDLCFVGTWVVADADGCRNRLHWVFPDGSYGHYDKAHLFRASSEASQLRRGTSRPIFEWRGLRIRPAVCYDLRFPTWLRNTATLDYDLLLLCANWPASRTQAWDTLLRARAIENLCYVAGCNRVGTDTTGIAYDGHSAIIDYKGFAIHSSSASPLPNDTTSPLLSATLDPTPLATFRHHWPFHLDFD